MMVFSLAAVVGAVLILRGYNRRRGTGGSAVEDFARFEI
jgi:hypothetical protein